MAHTLIPVTDANSGLLTGSVALTVDPAAADHLAFGRQPSSGSIGAVISPAVTVRVLDAYDHLVTTDYSDQVAVSLGSNPGAGVLGGTTTATTNGGVASFGNLSLDRPGVGYGSPGSKTQRPRQIAWSEADRDHRSTGFSAAKRTTDLLAMAGHSTTSPVKGASGRRWFVAVGGGRPAESGGREGE